MIKQTSKSVLSLLRQIPKRAPLLNFRGELASLQISHLYYTPTYNFAKISKKKNEKETHEKEKEEANLPKEIDLNALEAKMKKEMEHLKAELSKIKAGRITPQYFDSIKIQAYGKKSNLSELVQFIPKAANVMQLNVFDDGLCNEITKMLENSDKNLQLKKEGKMITCTMIGGNTKEMKDGLAKQVKQLGDKSKERVRDFRGEGVELVKKYEKFALKDVLHQATKEVQALHDQYLVEVDKIVKAKEKEIASA